MQAPEDRIEDRAASAPPTASAARPSRRRRQRTFGLALVALCALVAHATVLGSALFFDDVHTVRDNPHLDSFANLASVLTDPGLFSASGSAMYRPVVVASLILGEVAGGGAAWVHHLVDLLLHAATACAVFLLALGLRARPFGAACAAALFAAHPLATEAIHLVSARSDQVATLGLVLAMVLHLQAMRSARSAPWVVGVVIATALACGAKATAVVLPAALVLLEALVRPGHGVGAGILARAQRLVPAGAVVGAWLLARRVLLAPRPVVTASPPGADAAASPEALASLGTGIEPSIAGGVDPFFGAGREASVQLATMCGEILPRFLAQLVVPLGLSLDPPVHFVTVSDAPLQVVAGVGALLLASAWAVATAYRGAESGATGWRRVLGPRHPGRVVGVLVAWMAAAPWILIPLNSPAAEHRMYMPMALIAVAVAGALARPRRRGSGRAVAAGAVASAVVLLAFGSTLRGLQYRDDRTMWTAELARWPSSRHALMGLGVAALEEARAARAAGDGDGATARLVEARDWLARAAHHWPDSIAALENLAEIELTLGAEHGRPYVALVAAERLVARQPRGPFRRLLLARALACVGGLEASAGAKEGADAWFDAAVSAALSCLDIAEPKGLVFRTAAQAREVQGDLDAAVELLDRSVERGLDHVSVLLHRAALNMRRGDGRAVVRDLQTVRARDPMHPGLFELSRRWAATAPR